MENIPNLVDPIQLNNLKKIITTTDTKPRQLGGFFGFLSEKYRDNLAIIFTTIFFVLLGIFLYLRYKAKQAKNREAPINEFIQSVDNYLYSPVEYYHFSN